MKFGTKRNLGKPITIALLLSKNTVDGRKFASNFSDFLSRFVADFWQQNFMGGYQDFLPGFYDGFLLTFFQGFSSSRRKTRPGQNKKITKNEITDYIL